MAADQALPEVDPPVTGLQALFAALCARLYIIDLVQVRAVRRHSYYPLMGFMCWALARLPFLAGEWPRRAVAAGKERGALHGRTDIEKPRHLTRTLL
jgi:hypothetical protein